MKQFDSGTNAHEEFFMQNCSWLVNGPPRVSVLQARGLTVTLIQELRYRSLTDLQRYSCLTDLQKNYRLACVRMQWSACGGGAALETVPVLRLVFTA